MVGILKWYFILYKLFYCLSGIIKRVWKYELKIINVIKNYVLICFDIIWGKGFFKIL